jgi:cytidylate kinase
MIKIIAIEREFGCNTNASTIAETLGKRLGWKVLDQTLTEEVARTAQVAQAVVEQREECMDSVAGPKVFGRQLSRLFGKPKGVIEHVMVELVHKVFEEAAATGNCVIVGRGSAFFLRERTDTLRIFLFATREFKIRSLQTETKNEAKARELVDTVDHNRRAFVKHYFRVEWPYRPAYHAMLNSALADDFILATIQSLMDALNKGETSA